jgi:uncharacterized protein YkwD
MGQVIRLAGTVAAVAVFVGVGFPAGAHAASGRAAAPTVRQVSLERGIVAEINAFRRKRSLPALRVSRPLTAAAAGHSQSMGRFGFFAHESRDGSAFSKRVARAYKSSGFRRWTVGENLLWGTDLDAAASLAAWVASPGHLRNLLNPAWREIGLSAVRVRDAGGAFGGHDVTIVTADFGARSR